MKIADMAVSASRQEGLPVNVMEAIYLGLPIVATDCRGNRDLVTEYKRGYIINMGDSEAFEASVCRIYNDRHLPRTHGVSLLSSTDVILDRMRKIYR